MPAASNFSLGTVRLAQESAAAGFGLSVEAGRQWFALLGVGQSLRSELVSVGGGYRWRDGQSLSMQMTRSSEPSRLGLSMRYDWPRYYVRLGYDAQLGQGGAESVRFSAGIRF